MTCCKYIPFASLRAQKHWVNHHTAISWTTSKGFVRAVADSSKPHLPFPISPSLMTATFLPFFIWCKHNASSFLNGLTWSFSAMETYCDFEGTFTSLVVLDNIWFLRNGWCPFCRHCPEIKRRLCRAAGAYIILPGVGFRSLKKGHWSKIAMKKLTVSSNLPTPFEARPGSKFRIHIASHWKIESRGQLRCCFGNQKINFWT